MRRLTILACIAGLAAAPLPAFAYSCVLSPAKDAVIVKTDNPSDRETTCKVDCLFTSPEGPGYGFLRAADTGQQEGLVRLSAPDRRQGGRIRARKRKLPVVQEARLLPNSAANRFSPVRVKLTTRLPGAPSRAAQFSSVNLVIIAAPSVPAR